MECQQRQAGYGEFLGFRVGMDSSRRLPFRIPAARTAKETVAPLFQNLGANTPLEQLRRGLTSRSLADRRPKQKPRAACRLHIPQLIPSQFTINLVYEASSC
jgi:hypothetical protein